MNVASFVASEVVLLGVGLSTVSLSFGGLARGRTLMGTAGVAGVGILAGYAVLGLVTSLLAVSGATTRPMPLLLPLLALPVVGAGAMAVLRRRRVRAPSPGPLTERIADLVPVIVAIAGAGVLLRVAVHAIVKSNDE